MANTTTPQVVRTFLEQLEKALAGVPVDVRDEILAGVNEELAGLDARAAAVRIAALGDPEFIAAEARAESAKAVEPTLVEPLEARTAEPAWYPVLTALLVAFGGIVVPVIGWVVGLAMMWMSPSWRRADKWVASLAPVLTIAATAVIAGLVAAFTEPPSPEEANPLIPAMFDLVWSSILLALLVNVVVGIWLLWRAKKTPAPIAVRPPRTGTQPGWYPLVTVGLIAVGGYFAFFVGWAIGVVMLWASDRWTRGEKWLGTLAGPIALLATATSLVMIVVGLRLGSAGSLPFDPFLIVVFALLGAPLVANVIVGIRLLRGSSST